MKFLVIPNLSEAVKYSPIRRGTYLVGIATHPKGSWKYQDAFHRSFHGMKRTKDGRLIWKTLRTGRKLSEPQIRHQFRDVPYAAHNTAVSRDDVEKLADRTAQQGNISKERKDRYLRLAARLVKGWPKE